MSGNRQDEDILRLLDSGSSARDLLNDLGHFAGLGGERGSGVPGTPNEDALIDPLTQPIVPASSQAGSQTTAGLLQQLSTESQVLNGTLGEDTSGSGGNSILSVLSGFLGGSSGGLGGQGGGSFGGILGDILGGGLGLSPLISGLMDLFGGGSNSTTSPLSPFQMPASVEFQGGIDGPGGGGVTASDFGQNGLPRAAGQSNSPASAQQVTIQVNAMDSKSFLDHSDDIARAVRQAMLQSNSLNDVVAGI